jgi:O-antigen/teichoic acid export membrane protein
MLTRPPSRGRDKGSPEVSASASLRIYRPVRAARRYSTVVESESPDLKEGLSTVTRGTLFLIVATLCLVLSNFVTRVLLVHRLSQTDWTDFSIGFTLSLVLSSIGTLGLPNAVARSLPYASSDAERRTIVRVAVLAGSAAAVTVATSLWLVAPWVGSALGSSAIGLGLRFFAVAIAAQIVATILAAVFQGFADVTPNALFVQILDPALFLVFLVIPLAVPSIGLSYTAALVAFALANVAALVAIALYTVRRLPRHLPPGPLAPEAGRRLFLFALPLFVVGAMSSLAGSGDTLVLSAFHTAEVGAYSATLTLARLLQIGIGAASYIFLPVAARFHRRNDRQSLRLTYTTVTKWMVLFSMPLFFLFVFLARSSLGFVYGPGYTTTVLPLQITVVGSFAVTLLGPAATAQLAYGQVRALALNSIAAGLADVGLAVALVPRFGSAGSAAAWAIANLLYVGLCLAGLTATDGTHPFHRNFMVPLLTTAVPVGAVLLVFEPLVRTWMLPVVGIGIAGLFLLVVAVTRSVDEGDRLLLGAIEGLLGRQVPFVRWLGRWAAPRPPP